MQLLNCYLVSEPLDDFTFLANDTSNLLEEKYYIHYNFKISTYTFKATVKTYAELTNLRMATINSISCKCIIYITYKKTIVLWC